MSVNIIKPVKNVISGHSIGWLLFLLIPLSLYVALGFMGAAQNTAIFCAVCSGSVTLWLFTRLPDFLPAMLALLMLLLFDLTPESITLSGFSSPILILALSLMGIGIVVVQSGLISRTGMFLLRHLPTNNLVHQLAVLSVGFLYQSFTLHDNKREKIVLPMLPIIADTWGQTERQKNIRLLSSTAQDAVHYFSPLLLTAAPANLIVLAFFSSQEQSIFTFSFWLYAGSVTAVLLLAFYLITAFWYFKPTRTVKPNENSDRYLQSHEPMSSMEWKALIVIITLIVAILTQNFHQQPLSNICLAVFLMLLVMSGSHWKDYLSKINWDFIFLFACASGIFSVMKYLQLDFLLVAKLDWLSDFFIHYFMPAVFMLAGLIVMLRKFMSAQVVTLLFSFIFLPLSAYAGVNPWLFGLIILLFASTPRFEERSVSYFWDKKISGDMSLDDLKINKFQNLLWLMRLIAVYLSIPFWQVTGLL